MIVLEAGAGADLETWKPNFADLSALAPVVAYDRRGHGQSGPEPATPTLQRAIQTLRAMLRSAGADPPFVLVGHSWGGLIIRGFSDAYPADTAGLVYLDVPDFETTRQERAAVLPPEDRAAALAPPTAPPIPPETPEGLRPALQQMLHEMLNDYPTARAFRQPPGIPVAAVVTTRADRMRGNGGAIVRLQIRRQAEWTLSGPNGLFVLAGHTGHQVHRDDPPLVLRLVRHVIEQAARMKR